MKHKFLFIVSLIVCVSLCVSVCASAAFVDLQDLDPLGGTIYYYASNNAVDWDLQSGNWASGTGYQTGYSLSAIESQIVDNPGTQYAIGDGAVHNPTDVWNASDVEYTVLSTGDVLNQGSYTVSGKLRIRGLLRGFNVVSGNQSGTVYNVTGEFTPNITGLELLTYDGNEGDVTYSVQITDFGVDTYTNTGPNDAYILTSGSVSHNSETWLFAYNEYWVAYTATFNVTSNNISGYKIVWSPRGRMLHSCESTPGSASNYKIVGQSTSELVSRPPAYFSWSNGLGRDNTSQQTSTNVNRIYGVTSSIYEELVSQGMIMDDTMYDIEDYLRMINAYLTGAWSEETLIDQIYQTGVNNGLTLTNIYNKLLDTYTLISAIQTVLTNIKADTGAILTHVSSIDTVTSRFESEFVSWVTEYGLDMDQLFSDIARLHKMVDTWFNTIHNDLTALYQLIRDYFVSQSNAAQSGADDANDLNSDYTSSEDSALNSAGFDSSDNLFDVSFDTQLGENTSGLDLIRVLSSMLMNSIPVFSIGLSVGTMILVAKHIFKG